VDFVRVVLQLLYIIVRPLLVIAGKAMDNSMVYGEFLHLDKVLWTLRRIMMMVGNFTIVGLFLSNLISKQSFEKSMLVKLGAS
jgi:hypothetical protein